VLLDDGLIPGHERPGPRPGPGWQVADRDFLDDPAADLIADAAERRVP
jgi:hypothetical protein